MMTFKGPRFGRDALPDRDGTEVTVTGCECPTCRDMGAWLNEPYCRITFMSDGVTIGHAPLRWAVAS